MSWWKDVLVKTTKLGQKSGRQRVTQPEVNAICRKTMDFGGDATGSLKGEPLHLGQRCSDNYATKKREKKLRVGDWDVRGHRWVGELLTNTRKQSLNRKDETYFASFT